jgi:hypothetical protein
MGEFYAPGAGSVQMESGKKSPKMAILTAF